ncbi:Homeodomain-related protein [Cordyceps fumosorosea ARSEF 2679]|uniref:Homeodomain-related protein n=1 Tax=Cordyceps fumosorosea (strain ARSEF 2679) TaxID=1081104 RepID=A0A168EDD2_CORFA|nr:Homeodomain-related protein [Cordyceps fumosorosea ARSEF 2679]OAA73678.1 Homeodomain-related protein [Cordyceps fumosorosea ARSEF 2679]
MKTSKHSKQPSDSASTSRRREAQTRNSLAQAQAYQQRLSGGSAAYYAMPTTEAEVYDAYHANGVLPQHQHHQYQQYQQQVEPQDLRRSASSGDWSVHGEQQQQQQQQQQQYQQPQQQQQKQRPRLLKHAEAKTLLDARHRPSSGAWSIRDDQQLVMARSDGLNWSQIQEQFFPGKSSNACRKRHERLIDSKGRASGGGGDEAARVERVAAEYVQMRERLWRPLAEKTGEKWTFVERTCLSHGLKNLQGVARAASRRQRFDANAMAAAAAAAAVATTGYDDDSGVSGIGLTPVEDTSAGALAYSSSSPAPPSSHGGGGGGHVDMLTAASFASTATQATATTNATAYLAHLGPVAYANLMYGGTAAASATQYHPPHAYSSSISSDGSLHPGYVSRRGNESA